MEDKTNKADNVVIEVTSKNRIEEVLNADELSAEELEKLSDDVIVSDGEPLDENPEGLAGDAKALLGKFKAYIGGDKFDKACDDAAERNGVDKEIVKNAFVKNALGTIANALNLTVSMAGDIIKGAVMFIENIICTVADFATSTLHKLITALTLNCGTN